MTPPHPNQNPKTWQRRTLLAATGATLLAATCRAHAQALEKPRLTLAVGGKNLPYYLPLTLAEELGYFKAEGLDVKIVDYAGGSQALRALMGGSADVVSGAFEHTVTMQAKGQRLRAIVLMGRAPPIVLGANPKTMPNFKTVAKADELFGGPLPAACLYVAQRFVDRHPHTAQALATAIVRANQWIQRAGAGDIMKAVPETSLRGNRAVYIDAFLAAKGALSPDGLFPEKGPDTAYRALASIHPEIAKATLDLQALYTDDFVKAALIKYPGP